MIKLPIFSLRVRCSYKSLFGRLLLLCCFIFSARQINAQVGSFVALTHIPPHFNEGVMLLMTDGTVLCKTTSGGTYGTTWDKLTPDIHGSYLNGTWTTIAAMHDDRLYFSSQVLPDGRVYVAGGEYGSGGVRAEVYDPATNIWTKCPQLVVGAAISDANSELLIDGKVLQAIVDTGGTNLCTIYDPGSNTYAWTASTIRHDNEAMWVKLPDSTILFNDGFEATTSERYNQRTHTWITDGSLPVTLYDPYGDEAGAGFLLPNGKVYFIGSLPNSAYYTPTGTVSPGTWTAGPALPNGWGAPDAASAMMVNGHILMCLSPAPISPDHFPDSSAFFDFDYTTNTYTAVKGPGVAGDTVDGTPSYFSNMLCLPDGSLLFCNQYDNQYYEYTPGSAPLAAGQPTISNIVENTCTSFTIFGTNFNGITEGAGYGDDWQMSTNYPIVRLTSGTNVYYAKTSNWNRIGAVMTGALPDVASFTLPAGLPNGTYNVQVVVNGNPSANYSLTTGPAVLTPTVTTVCPGSTTTLSSSIGSGVWSSSNSAIASVDGSGDVSGILPGSATITYALGTCTSTATVSVNTAPAPITPLGAISVCVGSNTALTDATTGGAWTSANTGTATVISGVVTGVSSGSVDISYTAGLGCASVKNVTVNPLPGAITGTMTTCIGSNTALTDAGGGSWTSSNTLKATVGFGNGMVTGAGAGTSTITYTLSTGCITTTNVTVNPFPAAISGTLTVCQGLTTGLSDVSAGTWLSSNTSVAAIGFGSGLVTGVSNGTSTITFTTGTGCSSMAVVTVNPLPGSITGTKTVCPGNSTNLSDGGGGNWTSGSTSVATIGFGTGIASGVLAGTATITFTTGTGCIATTVLTVNPIPNAISGPTALCVGNSSTLSDAGLGTWTSSNTSVATVGFGSGLVNGLSAGTSTIIYTLGTGCANTVVVNVGLTSGPVTGNATVCAGSTTALTDAGGGTWTSSNTALATVDFVTGLVTGFAPGTVTIIYSLGTSCNSNYTITVDPAPSAISGTTTVCSGLTTSLTDVGGGTWSSSNTSVATIDGAGLATGVSSGTTTITYTTGVSCMITTPLTVNSAPIVAGLTGINNVCVGATTQLSDATPGGVWTSSNTLIATVGTAGLVSGGSTGITAIAYSITNSCGTTAPSATVSVNPLPVVLPITGSLSICLSSSNTLSDATPSGAWISSNTAIATVNSSGVATGVSTGMANIIYSVTNIFACTTIAEVTATVNPLVPVTVTPASATTFCTGGYVQLNSSTGPGYHYQWQVGGSNILGATTSSYISNYTGNFDVVISGPGLCNSTSALLSVVVNPSPIIVPSVTVTASPGTVLCNVTSMVTFTPTPSLPGLSTYQWFVNGSPVFAGGTFNYAPANGDIVKCLMTSSNICAFPDTAIGNVTMIISPLETPSVSIAANPSDTVCTGTITTFSAVPVFGGPAPSYQWINKTGSIVGVGPSFTYIPSDLDALTCAMVSDFACLLTPNATSGKLIIHVEAPSLNLDTIKVTRTKIVTGQVDTFVVVAPHGGSSPLYQWFLNALPIPGATNAAFITSGLSSGDKIFCQVTSSDECTSPKTNYSNVITLLSGTGVGNIMNPDAIFTIVPNPNKGEFTINGVLRNSTDNDVSIIITDMLGQTIYSKLAQANNGELTEHLTLASSIANGMYLVKITNGEDHEVFHIVVER